jgi:hypothetical protein
LPYSIDADIAEFGNFHTQSEIPLPVQYPFFSYTIVAGGNGIGAMLNKEMVLKYIPTSNAAVRMTISHNLPLVGLNKFSILVLKGCPFNEYLSFYEENQSPFTTVPVPLEAGEAYYFVLAIQNQPGISTAFSAFI